MSRVLILHDLEEGTAQQCLPDDSQDYSVISAVPTVHYCLGCFGCWVMTPGRCVIKDRTADFLRLLSQQDEVVFLSRLVFGGLSPDMKAFVDRSIGYVLPFFRNRNGEMHHAPRYDRSLKFKYIYYGADITVQEKATAQKLAEANALNLNSDQYSVHFYTSETECKAVFL